MPTIEQFYEKYWEIPDGNYDPTTPQRQALLRKHVTLRPNARILDVGCGRGEFCAFFRQLGWNPQGIDISRTGIAHARSQHAGISFRAIEVQALVPDEAEAYDCVFSSEVIEHLFDVQTYLESINRLLKSDGLLVLTTPYHSFIKNVIVDLLNYSKHYDPLGPHIRFFNQRSLEGVLRQCGFVPQVWTGYGRPWPFWKSFFVVSRKERAV